MELTEKPVRCPYCGESFSLTVDPSEGDDQSFVYDCEICCRPIDMQVTVDDRGVRVRPKQGSQL